MTKQIVNWQSIVPSKGHGEIMSESQFIIYTIIALFIISLLTFIFIVWLYAVGFSKIESIVIGTAYSLINILFQLLLFR